MSRIDEALSLAVAGFYVFPLKDPDALDKDGNPAGKSPRIKGWQGKSTTDPDQIKKWWDKWPNANIGVDTGKSGLLVIDIDPDKGGTLDALPLTAAELDTVTQQTGGGGLHLFYWQPVGMVFGNSSQRIAAGIDTRGRGGYIVAPSSIHPTSGAAYQWVEGKSPAHVSILPLPFAIGAALQDEPEPQKKAAQKVEPVATGDNPAYVKAAFKGELELLANAANGKRNDQLNKSAFNLGQIVAAGGLSESEVVSALESTALAIGLGETETRKSITSGLNAGKKKPRRIPAPKKNDFDAVAKGIKRKPIGNAPDKAYDGLRSMLKPKVTKPGEDVLRDRWIKTAGKVCYGLGEWLRYKNGLWEIVKDTTIKREVVRVLEKAKKEGISITTNKTRSVTELARIEVSVDDDGIFDASPDHLVCTNGTLHIPTRTLGPHTPDIYATTGISYDYDPKATPHNWDVYLAYLEKALGHDMVLFLKEFAGYALTTDTRHEIAVWLKGPRGCGKSTFIAGIEAMLGKRAGLLGLADIERSQFALGNIPGKTLLFATEQPDMFMKSSNVLNALISGETITVEKKFKDPIEITPKAKILWAMNSLPRLGDAADGLFRRVKVVEFPLLPKGDKRPELKEGIKQEGAGILNWALDGLDRLTRRGYFNIPDRVKAATGEFQAKNDIPAAFVQECCVTGTDANGNPYRAQTSTLYNAYKAWCIENGHKPQSSTSLADDWKRLGFERKRPGGIVHWFGVGLKV